MSSNIYKKLEYNEENEILDKSTFSSEYYDILTRLSKGVYIRVCFYFTRELRLLIATFHMQRFVRGDI